ncbi:MAG: HD domain-containing protein [Clostridia bacterium]|nr:HD domain-containing protein [Clostridia bacterium]
MEILKDKNNNNYIKDTNPYDKFTKIDNDILAFYMKYNQLKNIYRQGWLKVRIGLEHKEKCESIADHSFSVALLALTIIEKNKLSLDAFKCIKMGIIHELGEVYAGDFTPYDNITKEEKHLKENEAILNVLSSIDKDNDFYEIWNEFEEAKTDEAKFIKNIDQLEFLLQASAYGYDAKYFERCLSKITDPYCKEIALSAIEITNGNKKPKTVG